MAFNTVNTGLECIVNVPNSFVYLVYDDENCACINFHLIVNKLTELFILHNITRKRGIFSLELYNKSKICCISKSNFDRIRQNYVNNINHEVFYILDCYKLDEK